MTRTEITLALIFAASLASGQILFKIAADRNEIGHLSFTSILNLVLSPPMIIACVLYALTIIVYVMLLQTIPLSRAYFFSMLGAVIVPIAGLVVFREPITFRYAFGSTLVLIGLLAIATDSTSS
jgi:drug/metabolite transporter (DMT)-like permease